MEEKIVKNKIVLSLCILILVVTFSASCFAAEKILFALVGPMTGDSAAIGIQMENAVKLAVNEINESGGINGKEFKYIVGDDEANPNQAIIIAQKFSTNDDILYVLGPNNSSCALSSLPTWTKVGMPVISPNTTNPKLTKLGYENFLRICPTDDALQTELAELAVTELGFENIAIVWENTDYGKDSRDVIVKTITELGGKVAGDETYVPGVDRDYSSQITKFKGAGVDCVLIVGEYTAGALFLKQSQNLGFNAKIIGAHGFANPKLLEIAGEDAEDFIALSNFDPNDKRPQQAKFIENYNTLFGEKPGEYSAFSYDIVYMVKKAIEMGGTTREKLIEVLHKSDFEYNGVTGSIRFDENGDISGKKALVLEVKDGDFVIFDPTKI